MKTTYKKGATRLLLLLLMLAMCAIPVYADSLPEVPNSFYGNLTAGGQPVPAGAIVTAKVDGVEVGSLTVTESGKMGSATSNLVPRLVVQGGEEVSLNGKTVEFYIKSGTGATEVKADQTAVFQPEGVTNLDLTSAALPTVGAGGGGAAEPVTPAPTPEEITPPVIEAGTVQEGIDKIKTLTPQAASQVLAGVSAGKTAQILQGLPANTAAAIMKNLSASQLTQVIPYMSQQSLKNTLSKLSSNQLLQIDRSVLFNALSNVTTDKLVKEIPPAPPPGLGAPIIVYRTETGERCIAILTEAGEWVMIYGGVAVDEIKIKTSESLKNIETTVEIVTSPPEADKLPSNLKVFSFFKVTLVNITPQQMLVGHLRFHVDRKWIDDNDINTWGIELNRYDSAAGKWVKLPTVKKDETDDYIYFHSAINAFSLFAITGQTDADVRDFTASKMSISPTTAKIGEPVTITADIINELGLTDKYVAALWVNDTVEDVRYLTLAKGQSTQVKYTVIKKAAGTFEARIDREISSFQVTSEVVTPPPPPPAAKPAEFKAGPLSITPAEVETGKPVIILSTVTNSGGSEDTYEVVLKIDGVKVDSQMVTLGPGKSTDVSFRITKDAPGTYKVDINGQTGQFTVVKPAVVTPPPPPPPPKPFPWWWVVVGVVVVGAGVGVYLWRTKFRRT